MLHERVEWKNSFPCLLSWFQEFGLSDQLIQMERKMGCTFYMLIVCGYFQMPLPGMASIECPLYE